ncbi:ABC transporter substrate-binding protein [Paracoccus laeviglucosivorans]|uniref:Iron complex transport system substrate-binding protein n=1 Tax=Paracoccus laeviglucosivorans TaxID=1197861 RepID=A0A521EFD6_9RHOB|nr:ABC transporter substrate-binding protein [Paracoccus laeviglucosivorans]SMO82614.1 iron complex transport system substrate-binding protein [Paracoccus laeviglucosivorans]
MFLRPILAAVLIALAGTAQADVTATDILGRQVTLPEPAHRIVLGEGRHLSVLGLMHDDPVALVAGWRLDKPLDPPTLDAYRAKFPAIDAIKSVGAGNRDLSVEAVIALQPDLVVLTVIDQNDPKMTVARQQLEAAGIPVAFVDFFSHPQENTVPSLRILGALTGADARADEFVKFYESHMNRIRERLADAPRPRVFMHVHAAPVNCCSTVGPGVFHDFVTTAGGQNIGAEAVQGVLGNVSLEYLIGADPDFYIATGGTHMAARGGLVLGPQVDAEDAQASFDKLIAAPGISSLRAVQDGHAAGVWHLFNDSPIHIVLIEYLAKTFHPDLFEDLDPMATMRQIEATFSPVEVPGSWWVTPQQ